jgi:hypothetical protein
MVDIDPESLPYPPAKAVIRRGEWVRLAHELIDGASGQCLDLSLRDSDGVLYFLDGGVGFYSDSGELHEWPFETIDAYRASKARMAPASAHEGPWSWWWKVSASASGSGTCWPRMQTTSCGPCDPKPSRRSRERRA